MGWINDVVSYGEQYQAAQLASRDIVQSINMISGRLNNKPNQSRSALTMNREKRSLREFIANIANVRAIDAYASENPAYQGYLAMLNKVWKAVWFESKFPRAFKRNCQWMAAGGYAYISPVYRNIVMSARSKKRIDFDVFSANDVLSFQMPDNFDVQGAFAHTLIRFMPEFEAHAKFPKYASQLRPVARRRYSGNAAKDRISLAERFRTAASGQNSTTYSNWAAQVDEIRYTSIRDLSINTTKKPIAMGAPGAIESYVVPFVGQELQTEEFIQPGIRKTRKATEEDCYLYPNLRLLISQRGMQEPMYDGPGFSWHGMFPIARFSADEWPWEPGYSSARDISSLGESRQAFMRGMEQTAKQRFDPAILYDKSAGLNRKTMEMFDPYEERSRLGVDGTITDATLRTALPESMLNIPEWAFAWLKTLNDDEDYMLGQNAMENLAKAKMASADNAVEKAQEEAGPIVKDISYGFETPMQDVMMMALSDVLQYYPTGRIMTYVGPNGVDPITFDLNPDSLVPSHGHLEDPNETSVYTRMQRCQMFLQNFSSQIAPGSLHTNVATQQQLLFLQMQRAGFMISSETVAKACDIPNWGTLPGNTELEKWQNEQEMKLNFATRMKQLETALVPQGAAGPPPVNPLAEAGKGAPGRPPTGNKPAHMETKGSAEGQRVVIAH
jgi:hypothetical protein